MQPDILNNVHAVFFDLDNTLIDRDLAFEKGLPEWFRTNVPDISHEEYPEHIHRILKQDKSGYQDRYEFCGWIKSTYGLSRISPDQIQNEFSALIADNTVSNIDMIGLLSSLKRLFRIGIISNGSGIAQRTKIHKAGFECIFDHSTIYIEGERGHGKPNPSIFLLASKDHQIPPENFLFVGDHPVNDVLGAQQAGMKTCWISNGRPVTDLLVQSDFMLESIHDWDTSNVYV